MKTVEQPTKIDHRSNAGDTNVRFNGSPEDAYEPIYSTDDFSPQQPYVRQTEKDVSMLTPQAKAAYHRPTSGKKNRLDQHSNEVYNCFVTYWV